MEKNSSLEKVLEVSHGITTLLTTESKPKENLAAVLTMQRNIMELCVEQSQEAIKVIDDKLMLKVAREQMLLDKNNLDAVKQDLEEARVELQGRLRERDEQQEALARLAAELEEVKKTEEELKSQEEEITTEITDVIPSTKYIAQLLSKITLVRFDFDADPAVAKGVVGLKTGLQAFELDSREHSRSFIVNYLWSLVDSEW